MFIATATEVATKWLSSTHGTFFAMGSVLLSKATLIPAAIVALLGGAWLVTSKSGRKFLAEFLFHHSDNARRKSEIRQLLLAIVIGVILCVLIGVALYVLNKAKRI